MLNTLSPRSACSFVLGHRPSADSTLESVHRYKESSFGSPDPRVHIPLYDNTRDAHEVVEQDKLTIATLYVTGPVGRDGVSTVYCTHFDVNLKTHLTMYFVGEEDMVAVNYDFVLRCPVPRIPPNWQETSLSSSALDIRAQH